MLKPLLVKIHDFPKYLSVFSNTKLFSLTANSSPKIWVLIKNKMGKSYIGSIIASASAKMGILANGESKFRLDATGKSRMEIKGYSNTKLFKLSAIGETKVRTKGTGTGAVGKYKAYLDPARYYVGIPYLLGHWDGASNEILLSDIDDLTIHEMSIDEN